MNEHSEPETPSRQSQGGQTITANSHEDQGEGLDQDVAPVAEVARVTEDRRTVAACAYCGRGYMYINRDGIGCIDKSCGGRIWYLPEFEVGVDDDPLTRARRVKLLKNAALRTEVVQSD